MFAFAIDNIIRVFGNPEIQNLYLSDGLYISLQYFLLGVSSVYVMQNYMLLIAFFPSKNGNYRKDLKSLMGMLYGGQDYDENFHHVIFDFNTLSQDLKDIGFKSTQTWDTMEMNIDDFSKSFLPHMDFKNGKLMSLNIFATK